MMLQARDFDHRCTHDDCPSKGQRTDRLSCRCHIPREDMMLAEIDRLRARIAELEARRGVVTKLEGERNDV